MPTNVCLIIRCWRSQRLDLGNSGTSPGLTCLLVDDALETAPVI
jgi:hypothetical protein